MSATLLQNTKPNQVTTPPNTTKSNLRQTKIPQHQNKNNKLNNKPPNTEQQNK